MVFIKEADARTKEKETIADKIKQKAVKAARKAEKSQENHYENSYLLKTVLVFQWVHDG